MKDRYKTQTTNIIISIEMIENITSKSLMSASQVFFTLFSLFCHFHILSKNKLHYFFETNVQQTLFKHTLLKWIIILFHFSWFLTGFEKWRRDPKSIRLEDFKIKKKWHKLSPTFSKCRKIYFQIQYISITNMIHYKRCFIYSNKPTK